MYKIYTLRYLSISGVFLVQRVVLEIPNPIRFNQTEPTRVEFPKSTVLLGRCWVYLVPPKLLSKLKRSRKWRDLEEYMRLDVFKIFKLEIGTKLLTLEDITNFAKFFTFFSHDF